MDSLDDPPGEGFRPASGAEGGQNLVPDAPRLVDGDDGVEVAPLAALGGRQHDQQVGPVGVEAGLLVEGRVLPRVLPSVASLVLTAIEPVHGAYPVAGVGVPDGVEEGRYLPVEDGAGDELAALLPLHEVPVGVDQDDAACGRGLGQGYVACGDRHQRRQEQRGGQGYQSPGFPPGSVKGPSDGRLRSHVFASSSIRSFCLPSSLGSRGAGHHALKGGTRASSLLGHGKRWARCGVIPVYRDWRQCPKGKSGAVSNVKQAEMTGSGAGSASTFGLGLVAPFRGRAQNGSRYVCYIGASKWWSGAESGA